MNLDKYTQKSQEALLAAQHLAQDYQQQVVEPIHLLLALVQQQDGIVRAIITKVSGGTQAVQEELSNELDKKPKIQGSNLEVGLSPQAAEVLAAAERYAKGMQDDYVSTEHLLLGLADSSESKRLFQFGLTKDAILAASTLAILGFFVIPFKRKQAKDRFKEKMLSLRTKLLSALTTQFSNESENAIVRLKDGVAPYTRYVRSERERIDKAENTLARLRQNLSELRARSQAVVVK